MSDLFSEDKPQTGSATIENGMGVIRFPLSDLHSMRVMVKPCPCKAPKSASTSGIRDRFSKALALLAERMR